MFAHSGIEGNGPKLFNDGKNIQHVVLAQELSLGCWWVCPQELLISQPFHSVMVRAVT